MRHNPAVLSGTLVPISTLIEGNDILKRSLQRAITAYIDNNRLNEMNEMVTFFDQQHHHAETSQQVDQFKEKIEAAMNEELPNHENILKLETDVNFHFVVPSWFDLNICVGISSDYPRSFEENKELVQKCGKFESYSEFLIKPESMDGYHGLEFRLNGSVKDWLTKAELCVQTIGSDAITETCSKVNERLRVNIQDVFGESEKEKKSVNWMFKTGALKPIWADDVILCASYCSIGGTGSSNNRVCAKLNQWTEDLSSDSEISGIRMGLFHRRPELSEVEFSNGHCYATNDDNLLSVFQRYWVAFLITVSRPLFFAAFKRVHYFNELSFFSDT